MTLRTAALATQVYMMLGLTILIGASFVGSREDAYTWGLGVVWVGPLLSTLLHVGSGASRRVIAVIALIWILLAVAIGSLIQKGQV